MLELNSHDLESDLVPDTYTMDAESPAILAHSNTEFCPLIYELIPAHGCALRCEYCNVYSLKSERTHTPITVFPRYAELLRETIDRHLTGKRMPTYYFSPKTDVFQTALVQSGVTEEVLTVLVEKEVDFLLVTKGRLPNLRILDLLERAKPHGRVCVSLGMKNEAHARAMEPGAATLEERWELTRLCTERGIPMMGTIEPILPLSDLSFVRDIIRRFVELGVDHFAVDFARVSHECLERMIAKLPELAELRELYYHPDAVPQEFETNPYYREKVMRYAPPTAWLTEKFGLLKEYANEVRSTISGCSYFKVPGLNDEALERGFLCFGIHDPERAARNARRANALPVVAG
jgi:DNA repair photolyase